VSENIIFMFLEAKLLSNAFVKLFKIGFSAFWLSAFTDRAEATA
jgi:hypothetical protein